MWTGAIDLSLPPDQVLDKEVNMFQGGSVSEFTPSKKYRRRLKPVRDASFRISVPEICRPGTRESDCGLYIAAFAKNHVFAPCSRHDLTRNTPVK